MRARLSLQLLPPVVDAAIAVVVAGVVLVGTVMAARAQTAHPIDVLGGALIIAAGLALAWRRRAPLVVLTAVVLLLSAYLLLGYPFGPVQLCMVIAMFELARLRRLRISASACAAAIAVSGAAVVLRALVPAASPALMLALWASWLLVPWSLGALVQVRTSATRRAREDLAARAALQERIRITGEVHDVAGHGLSAVAMQAGVALLVFDEQPAQARRCLESIKSTSDDALADLRTILDDSRQPAGPGGMDGLGRLAERTRTAGVPVQLSVSAPPVAADVGDAVFGVVREALTNVLRHAGPASVAVQIRSGQRALEVEVLDDGAGGAASPAGSGISGMRSRVAALGGELSAEPRATRGFRVFARIPLAGGTR